MILTILTVLVLAPLPLYFLWRLVHRTLQRRKLSRTPFPLAWEEILKKEFPLYNKLPQHLQIDLQNRIEFFIAEKHFEGCGGFEITDEVRVLIAAQASLLLLNTPHRIFPRLTTILVYPSTYVAQNIQSNGITQSSEGVVVEGQSSGWGEQVILGWSHVVQGAMNDSDGHNVVFHEFAHQLDSESGAANGVPHFNRGQGAMYQPWLTTVGEEFSEFLVKVEKHQKDVIDTYGATNSAEFFAVVTETFFEKPHQLYKEHPALFEQFKEFYNLDPRDWE